MTQDAVGGPEETKTAGGTLQVQMRPTSRDKEGRDHLPKESAPSDSQLVRLVQAGDQRAFGVLIERYGRQVLNTCWRICGHMEDARDLSQEAFLHAFRRIRDFRLDSQFYTWLYRIAVNVSISHRRKMKYRTTTSLDAAVAQRGAEPPDAGRRMNETPDHVVETAERRERLSAALNRLDDDHRTVIVLRDLEGLGYADIAEVLEVPVGTVRSRLHRARHELLALMEPEKADVTSWPSRT